MSYRRLYSLSVKRQAVGRGGGGGGGLEGAMLHFSVAYFSPCHMSLSLILEGDQEGVTYV